MENNKPHYVYFMRSGQFLKIGHAANVRNRRQNLSSGNPEKITIEKRLRLPSRSSAESLEKQLHASFAHERKRGEWFKISAHEAVLAAHEACLKIGVHFDKEISTDAELVFSDSPVSRPDDPIMRMVRALARRQARIDCGLKP